MTQTNGLTSADFAVFDLILGKANMQQLIRIAKAVELEMKECMDACREQMRAALNEKKWRHELSAEEQEAYDTWLAQDK